MRNVYREGQQGLQMIVLHTWDTNQYYSVSFMLIHFVLLCKMRAENTQRLSAQRSDIRMSHLRPLSGAK